ncbi:MAG: prepilin-type N-terminal cleavage/methylation domain-containing protein [Kiritimatiellia bacterium]
MTSRTRGGFTLIEVLLVAVIMGFIAAIAAPTFVNSLKGQRLRQARRTAMACGRYARTMAVSRQRTMNLVVTVSGSAIAVEEGAAARTMSDPVYTRDQLETLTNAPPGSELEPRLTPQPPLPSRSLSRTLEGVVIRRLTVRNGLDEETGGTVKIPYKSNGTCPPYELVLADEEGTESTIVVDFLGDATHEEE